MIKFIGESLENFKEEEHWKEEHFNWLNDFLNDTEQKTVFFWNDFEDFTLRVSNLAPPKFYGKYQSSYHHLQKLLKLSVRIISRILACFLVLKPVMQGGYPVCTSEWTESSVFM